MTNQSNSELCALILASFIVGILATYGLIYTLHHYEYDSQIVTMAHSYKLLNENIIEFDAPYYKYYCLAQMTNMQYCYIFQYQSIHDELEEVCNTNKTGFKCEHGGYCFDCPEESIDNASLKYCSRAFGCAAMVILCGFVIFESILKLRSQYMKLNTEEHSDTESLDESL